jgi:tRNA/tmRNA/rRNA uracil-C5-methylase (TrmA/RlmC/RlmD family)
MADKRPRKPTPPMGSRRPDPPTGGRRPAANGGAASRRPKTGGVPPPARTTPPARTPPARSFTPPPRFTPARPTHPPNSFAALFTAKLRSLHRTQLPPERGACTDADGRRCTVCHASSHPYPQEAEAREAALHDFWRLHKLAGVARPLVRTGSGRWYRIVTKRKAWQPQRGGARLGLIDPAGGPAVEIGRCAIETPAHGEIYHTLALALQAPVGRPLGAELRHAVIKGNADEHTLILSVGGLDPRVMRAATTVSKQLTRTHATIKAVFLFEDETDGRYYLGTRHADAQPALRKLFGASEIFHRIGGKPFLHHPLSFTQVNAEGAERLVQSVVAFLKPEKTISFYDFYCGYGMFTLSLAPDLRAATGVELSHAAVASAKANATRQHAANARFVRADIAPETVYRTMARSTPDDIVLLDPPRGGVEEGVIEAIAERGPARVAHIFCAIDLVPADLARWTANGYTVRSIIPFDNFAGTDEVEVLACLERTR